MAVPLVAITSAPLDLQALIAAIAGGASGDGAISSFAGLVRDHNQGRRVEYLDYEAYEPLAVRALNRILEEAQQAWPSARLGIHHRTGRLEIGEASIIIVGDGRQFMQELKNKLPKAEVIPIDKLDLNKAGLVKP